MRPKSIRWRMWRVRHGKRLHPVISWLMKVTYHPHRLDFAPDQVVVLFPDMVTATSASKLMSAVGLVLTVNGVKFGNKEPDVFLATGDRLNLALGHLDSTKKGSIFE